MSNPPAPEAGHPYVRHCHHCATSRPDHPDHHLTPCTAVVAGKPCYGATRGEQVRYVSPVERERDEARAALARLRAQLAGMCDAADHAVGYDGSGPSGRLWTVRVRALIDDNTPAQLKEPS